MTFFKTQEVAPRLEIPMRYDDIALNQRYRVREMYMVQQKGLCYHCKSSLMEPPPKEVTDIPVTKDMFPDNFFKSPQHLHHSHDTGMTLGVVHAYCNAILWQYHGE